MDSLFANYASSDEEGEDSKPQNLPSNPTKPIVGHRSNGNQEESELTNSHPKSSSSLFGSLPPPKSSSSSSSLFSTVPAPKSRKSVPAPQLSELNSSVTATKKVVQFRPPPIGLSMNSVNEDEDDDDDEDKKVKQKTNSGITTVKSLFSSMPAPKNSGTFGALPSASGTGRRSMLEADVPATSDPNLVNTVNNEISNVAGSTYNQSSVDPNSFSGYAGSSDHSNLASGGENYAGYDTTDSYQSDEAGGWGGGSGNYGNYGSGYANNDTYDYTSNSADRSITRVPSFEIPVRLPGKRGRNEVPTEIIEVNQDDLMKNRPREDKAKATGIAFGPSYQPVSAKGKPSKLLKRKHQIGSLYFDMKQNETLLQERRSKGLLTKAQTHAKYGWA